MKEIIELLEKNELIKFNFINNFNWCDEYYDNLELWQEFYKGNVEGFHNYHYTNNLGKICKCKRITLGMAKTVCEEWASLLNYPYIGTDNDEINQYLEKVFQENNFKSTFANFIEKTFAFGNGILIVNNDEIRKIPKIEERYIWNTIPLEVYNGQIKSILILGDQIQISENLFSRECLIIGESIYEKNNAQFTGTKYINFTINSQQKKVDNNSRIIISNENITNNNFSNLKYFHFFKPALTNNLFLSDNLGISVFGNSINILKQLDIAYDSLQNDFSKGKMKMMISNEIMKKDEEGNVISNAIDDDQTLFIADLYDKTTSELQKSDGKSPILNDLMKEINIPIRVDVHIQGIQFNLELLSQKCGLGTGYFKFNNSAGVTKTATEVISQKSELFRNMKKHEFLIKQSLASLVDDIIKIGFQNNSIKKQEYEIMIEFDDSIANDDNTIREEMRKDVSLGILSKKYYLMQQYNLTDEEVEEMLKQINIENNVDNLDEIKLENNQEID